jgi:hypothetical protein
MGRSEINQGEGSNGGDASMFEAIVSQVKTGRVQRKLFETREQAEKFLAETEERLVNPPKMWDVRRDEWVQPKPRSLRDYRLEIAYREPATIVKVAERIKRRKKVAA